MLITNEKTECLGKGIDNTKKNPSRNFTIEKDSNKNFNDELKKKGKIRRKNQ